VWWDRVLVGVLVVTAVVEGAARPDVSPRVPSIVISVLLVLSLFWRRTRPLPAVAFAFGLCVLSAVVAGREFPDQYVLVALLLLPFSVFRWGTGRELVLGAAFVLAKLGVSAVLGYLSLADTAAGIVVLSMAMAVGAALRYRSRARSRELDQVKLLEREQLARDLHDTVAHHVSAMAIRAQAGIATSAADPGAAVDALKVIDAEAARALDEMRGMVRILRTQKAADRSPGPRVADLERLASLSNPSVDVRVTGDADALPSPVGAAVFRLAQEAVTNARRHARHATRIDVRVTVDDSEVRVLVTDDGVSRQTGPRGYGLTGMIERASLLGGTCEAGPNPDRGWTVSAVLPREVTA
jgi:signal transduction histidine kinase